MTRKSLNPKRAIRDRTPDDDDWLTRAATATYKGNPQHKRHPGDFGLEPPSAPRQDKSLCDLVGVFDRDVAESLLREGFRRGLVSVQTRNGWPQNVWAVAAGYAVEAMLENQETGAYHGYPMPEHDPLRDDVVRRWERS